MLHDGQYSSTLLVLLLLSFSYCYYVAIMEVRWTFAWTRAGGAHQLTTVK